MARIGIYGGSFNPPHLGHITAALQAVDALCLDKVLMIPAGVAPHKQLPSNSPTPWQRLEMLRLAVRGNSKIEVSDIELRREGKSYTYQTILQLKQMYPRDELILLMGTDMFLSLDSWKNPQIILENAAVGVLYRGQADEKDAIAAKMAQMNGKIFLVENDVLTVSSTDLRRMLIMNCADSFLPKGVSAYVAENGLYGTGKDYQKLSMEELESVVIGLLKPNRVAHVLGCRDTAVSMAKRWGADETDAARAGLLHDITKALDGPLQLTLCREYGKILDAFSEKNPKIIHALTGSLVAQRIFGENENVVQAIRWHTTGKPGMSLLDKIIYVADYIEPTRDFPNVDTLRELAYSDLNAAVRLGLEMAIDLLRKQGREVCPQSLETLAWLR